MNECREARESSRRRRRRKERESKRGPISRLGCGPFFGPVSLHHPIAPLLSLDQHTVPARTRTIWGPIVHTDPRTVTHATYVCRAHARAHALVRVLNNAYGDRVWLSCTPKDTHARDRFVWTRKTTLLGDRRERVLWIRSY